MANRLYFISTASDAFNRTSMELKHILDKDLPLIVNALLIEPVWN